MKIAIDISPLETGHAQRGIGTYTDLLVKALEKYESSNEYILFDRKEKIPDKVDLIHIPYFDPFFITLRFYLRTPFIVTVHDLIPLAYPKLFPRGIRGELKWQIQKMLLRRSDMIITDSESSKKDIINYAGFSEDKIQVVYLAPNNIFSHVSDNIKLSNIRKKYHLPDNFMLYIGDVNRNKNIIGLIQAFKIAAAKVIGKDISLVLVGKAFLDMNLLETQEIDHEIRRLDIGKQIVKTGFVDDIDLLCLYSMATGYIQPSIAEGFGLPILEAMISGCPVITSNKTSLFEIAGPAVTFDPLNVIDIAQKIIHLVNLDTKDRQKMIIDGYAWAKRFSWQKVARETTLIYEKISAK